MMEIAVAFSPRALREIRREQWLADARDAPSEGLQPSAVVTGALWAVLVSRGRRASQSTHTNNGRQGKIMVLRPAGVSRAVRVLATTAGVALVASLGSGVPSTAASLLSDLASGATHASNQSATSDSVVYATPEDGPAPSKTDLSTLKIVGTIDPATGEITDLDAPSDVDSVAVSAPQP